MARTETDNLGSSEIGDDRLLELGLVRPEEEMVRPSAILAGG